MAKKKAKKAAEKSRPTRAPRKPHNWDKVLMAAYVISLGGTIDAAAEMAGCAERTVRNWKSAPWWAEAKQGAVAKWKGDVLAAAKRGVLSIIKEKDPHTTRWALERLMPEDFARPPQRHDIGLGDGATDIQATLTIGGKPVGES